MKKFRGLDFIKNNWVYGDLVNKGEEKYICNYIDNNFVFTKIHNGTEGQFIKTFTECNIDMYEGDIVILHRWGDEYQFTVTTILRIDQMLTGQPEKIEIIGNIHQNYKIFKNRPFYMDKKVDVYRSLQYKRQKVFSIRQNGLVIGHATNIPTKDTSITLSDVEYIVNTKGVDRIIKNGKRENVAFVRGFYKKPIQEYDIKEKVSYNPLNDPYFRTLDGKRVNYSEEAIIDKNILYAYKPKYYEKDN